MKNAFRKTEPIQYMIRTYAGSNKSQMRLDPKTT